MSGRILSTLTSNVKWNCDNTATADVTSALDVFAVYCSAAEKETVLLVTDTATETYPHPTNRISSFSASPSETGSGGSSSDDGGNSSDKNGKDGSSSDGSGSNSSDSSSKANSINKTAVIAACVLAGVVLIAAIAAVAFFVRRKRNKNKGEQLPTVDGPHLEGPPELENTAKMGPNVAVVPELHSIERQELQGHTGTPASELPPGYATPRPELQGSSEYKPPVSPVHGGGYQPPHSPYGGHQQGAATVSPATPNTYGAGWQSGPVAETYELDSATWKAS